MLFRSSLVGLTVIDDDNLEFFIGLLGQRGHELRQAFFSVIGGHDYREKHVLSTSTLFIKRLIFA